MLGVFCVRCVFDFSGVFCFVTWHGRDSGQLTSHLDAVSPQIVPGWLGAFLSQSPEGSAFETSLSLHLPLLLVLSCSGML